MPDTVIVGYRTCNSSEVNGLPIEKGSMILAKDTGAMYADTVDGDRVPISRQTTFITEEQRQAMLAPEEDMLYITIDDFKIWIYFNNAWACLTRDIELNVMTNEDIDNIINGVETVVARPKSVTFTFDANGGAFADSSTTVTATGTYVEAEDSYNIPDNPDDPTLEGSVFTGWQINGEAFASPIAASKVIDENDTPVNTTIVAQWTAATTE